MQPSAVHLTLLASVLGLSLAAGSSSKNCSDVKGTISCYTCMGRDMENCETGLTCCKGSCYKLVDTEHNLVAKGCTNDDEEDGSMKRRTLNVELYFANREKITGESYFCNGKQEFCNGGYTLSTITSVVALLVLTLFH